MGMQAWTAIGLVALASAGAARGAPPSSGCPMMRPDVDARTSRDCLACHDRLADHAHPVDLDYAGARRTDLRPVEEVVRRGVFLPEGQIRCVTCHDGGSPWKSHIALPPGATPRAAVDPRDPRTYEAREKPAAPPPGSAVVARPLCLACHALD